MEMEWIRHADDSNQSNNLNFMTSFFPIEPSVWSRDVARWVRSDLAVSGPFVCRCLISRAVLRFHIPLIEPDVRFSRIRLSKEAHDFAHEKLCVRSTSRIRP